MVVRRLYDEDEEGEAMTRRTRRFISVREAARRLEVHENTIRNMVARGELVDARVPGTSYIRIDAAQIRALIDARPTYDETGTDD
jgi:excisionase family DNA binding protein